MKNHLTSITKIKKEFPLFFKKEIMQSFNSKISKEVKVTDIGTYFITSEIFTKDNKEEKNLRQELINKPITSKPTITNS